MPERDISQLISSVSQRGSTLGHLPEPGEVRRRFARKASAGPRQWGPLPRRLAVALVAVVIAIVFFVPLPHTSLFTHITSTPASSRALTTGTTLPASSVTAEYVVPVGSSGLWVVWVQGQGATGDEQGMEHSTDAGRTWTDVTPPGLHKLVGDSYISDLFALNADDAWVTYGPVASGSPQVIAATSDAGQHWHVVGRIPTSWGCRLQFVTATDGWCPAIGAASGSAGVKLYRTRDGGRHWQLVSFSSLQGPSSKGSLPLYCDKVIGFLSTDEGWAGFYCDAGFAPLYETTNGGATWKAATLVPPPGVSRPDAGSGVGGIPVLHGGDGAVGYSFASPTSSGTVVYVTEDAGAAWRAVVPPGPQRNWSVDIVTPSEWRLANGNEILATNDAGRTWRTIRSNLTDMFFTDTITNSSQAPLGFVNEDVGWTTAGEGPEGNPLLWRTTDGGAVWRLVPIPGV